ncbi:MAG: asparagine synthase (glutamine-hydrolyzing) [Elusimicrobiota bacterium]
MCGIVGCFSREGVSRDILTAMRDSMRHRGPDDCGLWISGDGLLGLAHRRLSIIDLTDAGRQPLWDAAGRIGVVFNGEIYNHLDLRAELSALGFRFMTRTDTEVIACAYLAWKDDFVSHLRGMFALALYDSLEKILILARDRIGKKPLYYFGSDGVFCFSSELRALRLHPRTPADLDAESLNYYLARGYVPGDKSIIRGVKKLLPGHILKFAISGNNTEIHSYWNLPEPQISSLSDAEMADRLGVLLIDSVRARLISSDVPVGVLLSGGLDSSLIVAAAAKASTATIRTFTITNPQNPEFDESKRARAISGAFGCRHEELPADALLPNPDEIFNLCDEPMADSSFIPTLMVSRLARRHVKVVLGGDGGDELFGGYPYYRTSLRIMRTWGRLPKIFTKISSAAAALMPSGTKTRATLLALGSYDGTRYVSRPQFFDRFSRRNIFKPEILAELGAAIDAPESGDSWSQVSRFSPIQRFTRHDMRRYLSEDILVKVDRASMAASLEVRAPWLDQSLVEFAFGQIPDRLKTNARETRIIQRLLAAQWLPRQIDMKRKQGFSIPLDDWLRNQWRNYLRMPMPRLEKFLEKNAAKNIEKEILSGKNSGQRWYALAALEHWLER